MALFKTNSMNLYFWLRKTAKTNTLYCQVYLLGRQSTAFSTGIRLRPEDWNPKTHEIGGKDASTKARTLYEIKAGLLAAYHDLSREREAPTADDVRNRFLDKAQPQRVELEP